MGNKNEEDGLFEVFMLIYQLSSLVFLDYEFAEEHYGLVYAKLAIEIWIETLSESWNEI